MANKTHIHGGEGEKPIGAAKKQVREVWDSVNTKIAWDALSSADKLEIVRKFIKYSIMRWFGVS